MQAMHATQMLLILLWNKPRSVEWSILLVLTSSWQNQGFSAHAATTIARHKHQRSILLLAMLGECVGDSAQGSVSASCTSEESPSC
jgi:hypothetical protein